MRAGPAALRFDWSRVGLDMDLPVFVYSHMKSGLKFLSRQGACSGQLSRQLEIFQFQTTQIEPNRKDRVLVLSGLESVKVWLS